MKYKSFKQLYDEMETDPLYQQYKKALENELAQKEVNELMDSWPSWCPKTKRRTEEAICAHCRRKCEFVRRKDA